RFINRSADFRVLYSFCFLFLINKKFSPEMFKEVHIKVEDSKAESLVSFLKELDFVKIEKQPKTPKPLKTTAKVSKAAHLPFFALCPDWKVEADEVSSTGLVKRREGW